MPNELEWVQSIEELRENIRVFADSVEAGDKRSQWVTAHPRYFVYDPVTDRFGPAKFVAFRGMTVEHYADLQALQRDKVAPSLFDGHRAHKTLSKLLAGRAFVPRLALAERLKSEYGSAFGPSAFQETPTEELFFLQIDSAGSVWWVNQGKTYRQERDGGYLWAPQVNRRGDPVEHHVRMREIRVDDVIVHYAKGAVRAISRASSTAVETQRPAELSEEWERAGYLLRSEYFELAEPVKLLEIPQVLRSVDAGPFDRNGSGKQGYLYPLDSAVADAIAQKFSDRWPPASPWGTQKRFITSRSFRLPEVADKLQAEVYFNLWQRKLWPYDAVDEGDVLYFYEGPNKKLVWKTTIRRIGRIEYSNKGELQGFLESTFGIRDAKESEYFKSAAESGYCFAFQVKPQQRLDLPKPDSIRMPQQGWLRVGPDIARDWLGEKGMTDQFSLREAMPSVLNYISSRGFIFEPWQVAAYITALRTKPFVILAGVTGTGKSKLPRLVADATGGHSHLIAVRPDWTDSSDVLGYTDLQGDFRPGLLLEVARNASEAPDKSFLCIVDEMNLARVEHYLAEVLSRIEDREADPGGGFRSSELVSQELSEADRAWGQVCLPPNLGLVGTVNMDESAHGFSRKVLDRAFTLELSEISLGEWTNKATSEAPPVAWPISVWYPRAIRLGQLQPSSDDEEVVGLVINELTQLNNYLRQAQLQIGYRSRDEIALFALNARELKHLFVDNGGHPVDPLDLALQMKILPRIVGGSNAIRRLLLNLMGWTQSGIPIEATEEARANDLRDQWSKEACPSRMSNARYPGTLSRLCLMWDRLQSEGFTSYWL